MRILDTLIGSGESRKSQQGILLRTVGEDGGLVDPTEVMGTDSEISPDIVDSGLVSTITELASKNPEELTIDELNLLKRLF